MLYLPMNFLADVTQCKRYFYHMLNSIKLGLLFFLSHVIYFKAERTGGGDCITPRAAIYPRRRNIIWQSVIAIPRTLPRQFMIENKAGQKKNVYRYAAFIRQFNPKAKTRCVLSTPGKLPPGDRSVIWMNESHPVGR